nr:AbfB domain-containing protein [Saccharothrix saharensis]
MDAADQGALHPAAQRQAPHDLRHHRDRAADDGSPTFAADATFHRVAGLADSSWTSFRSHNFADRYIRHADYVLRIDPISTTADRADATFQVGY